MLAGLRGSEAGFFIALGRPMVRLEWSGALRWEDWGRTGYGLAGIILTRSHPFCAAEAGRSESNLGAVDPKHKRAQNATKAYRRYVATPPAPPGAAARQRRRPIPPRQLRQTTRQDKTRHTNDIAACQPTGVPTHRPTDAGVAHLGCRMLPRGQTHTCVLCF